MNDAESIVRTWLDGQFTERVVTEVPADLTVPVVRVLRVGGGSVFVLDRAVFSVECFAPDRATARALALSVEDKLCFSLPRSVISGVAAVTYVSKTAGPFAMPWDNPNVRRFGATYEITIR